MAKPSTLEKVQKAIEALKKGNKAITIAGVAKKAGIERKTLYNNPDLLLMVKQAMAIQETKIEPKPTGQTKAVSILEERIKDYRQEIQNLQREKAKLLSQNKILTEEVLRLQRRIDELEETIKNVGERQVIQLTPKGER